jgi:hypothetical protein
VSPDFVPAWSFLQISNAKAGMITKQATAWRPNVPTSAIKEPILCPWDIDFSTCGDMIIVTIPATISRMHAKSAANPRTATRGNLHSSRVDSHVISPKMFWGGQQFQRNRRDGLRHGPKMKGCIWSDKPTWNTITSHLDNLSYVWQVNSSAIMYKLSHWSMESS